MVEAKKALGQAVDYDPLAAPHPENWLEMGEGERIVLVKEYHRFAGLSLGSAKRDSVHAVVHCVIENQATMDVEGTRERLAKLQLEGMDRHEAIHEMGRDFLEDYTIEINRLRKRDTSS